MTHTKRYQVGTISGAQAFILADNDGDVLMARTERMFGPGNELYVFTPEAQATLRKALKRAARIRRERGEA